jgi:hypothetical protein
VGTNFDDAGEFRTGMVELKLPSLTPPSPPDTSDPLSVEVWKMELREHREKTRAREKNSSRVVALVLGQCSQALRNRMEADPTWSSINATSDAIALLQLIQHCMSQHQTRQYEVHTLIDAESDVLNFKQGQYMANNVYFDRFKDKMQTAVRLGSTLGAHPHRSGRDFEDHHRG